MDPGLAELLFTGDPAVITVDGEETYMDLQELCLILLDEVIFFRCCACLFAFAFYESVTGWGSKVSCMPAIIKDPQVTYDVGAV